MTGDIESTGHRNWVPIPLDVAPDAVHAQLLDRFSGAGADDRVADTAAALTGAANQLLAANEQSRADGVQNLAAWALVGDDDILDVHGFATLRISPLEEALSDEAYVRLLTDGETLFQPPLVETMETMSGDAISLRFRPMFDDSGESQVHQVSAVLWPRPEAEALYTLSSYSTDLVEAAEAGDLLDELGAGFKGL